MTDQPIFVIHGIANREPEAFQLRVDRLGRNLGRTDLIAVYWGDLGADHQFVDRVVPPAPRGRHPVRDGDDPIDDRLIDDDVMGLAAALLRPGPFGAAPMTALLAGARAALDADEPAAEAVRDDDLDTEILAALADAWTDLELPWLERINDADLLAGVGAHVAETTAAILSDEDGGYELRAGRVRTVVGVVLRGADRLTATTMGTAAARFTGWVRVHGAEGFARNVGDLLGYQRHRTEILDRVRSVIHAAAGPDAGRDEKHRVHLVGHSLGATIAMDLATAAEDPVYTESVVTFGSHWPVLHLWRPTPTVPPYEGEPVELPPSVGTWVNLWERLDLLAFLAAPVFVLANGRPPRDVELRHGYGRTLFTHSVYWESPELWAHLGDLWGAHDDS